MDLRGSPERERERERALIFKRERKRLAHRHFYVGNYSGMRGGFDEKSIRKVAVAMGYPVYDQLWV